jgi:hypothetical protein
MSAWSLTLSTGWNWKVTGIYTIFVEVCQWRGKRQEATVDECHVLGYTNPAVRLKPVTYLKREIADYLMP